jgi:hypothetical protein
MNATVHTFNFVGKAEDLVDTVGDADPPPGDEGGRPQQGPSPLHRRLPARRTRIPRPIRGLVRDEG